MKLKSSEQQINLSPTVRKRDQEDYAIFLNWLTNRNSFEYHNSDLHSLSSGSFREIGREIQEKLDDEVFRNIKLKRKAIKPLDAQTNAFSIEKNMVYVNPDILFTRYNYCTTG